MRISDLTAYAADKYNIQEEHKWADFPGFSVLTDPKSGKWAALLMRRWDSETGTEIECCDLKCGNEVLYYAKKPYLSKPVRMHGAKWINITFDDSTEEDVVYRLFDKAINPKSAFGHTIVLGSQLKAGESRYEDTALPFGMQRGLPVRDNQPERLRNMRRLYGYGRGGSGSKAENFYQQALYLKDYEDNFPWKGEFVCYFPTYDDMTTRQLRGYFTWRTGLRKGEYGAIPASAAYIYIYELLNGIGADSPEDCLEKLREFETGYIIPIADDKRMRNNLHRWMLDFSVLNDLPAETANSVADPNLKARDDALSVLRNADVHTDEEVFEALFYFGSKRSKESPVVMKEPERGRHLFCEAWRSAMAYRENDEDLFTLCFGTRKRRQWYPLSQAIYYDRSGGEDREYVQNDSRRYICRDGVWYIESYETLYYHRERFLGFLSETDARLRRYLKTGRYLKEKQENEWAVPFIEAVLEKDRKEQLEAARPRITIDLSDLERIRRDAVVTRDSLLTEEDLDETDHFAESSEPDVLTDSRQTDLPIDPVQTEILRELLQGGDAADILKANHMMPSIAADFINEALFDEIGDTLLICEDDRLSLVDDYIEDLNELLGGHGNGQA